MKATSAHDAEVQEGMRRVVLSAPQADTGAPVEPLEVLYFRDAVTNIPLQASKWELDDDDRARIAAGGAVWLVVLTEVGQHPPVIVTTAFQEMLDVDSSGDVDI